MTPDVQIRGHSQRGNLEGLSPSRNVASNKQRNIFSPDYWQAQFTGEWCAILPRGKTMLINCMQSAMHTGKEICLLTLVPPPTPLHTGTPLPWKSEPSITKISGYANGTYNTG